jgi:hypothetical protein
VTSEGPRGQRYECRVIPEAVEYLCDRAAGGRITSVRASAILEPVAERFSLPYTYGDRLRFSGQYVLLAAAESADSISSAAIMITSRGSRPHSRKATIVTIATTRPHI